MKNGGSIEISGSKYWRIVTPRGFDGNAKRKAVYCRTKEEADKLRSRIKYWKFRRQNPVESSADITPEQKRWLGYLVNELGEDLSLLPAIVGHWKKTAKAVNNPATAFRLAESYVISRSSDLNPKTLSDVRHRVKRFAEMYEHKPVTEITPLDIRNFLNGHQHKTSQRNDYKALSPMFQFAIEQGMLVKNPLDEVKRPRPTHAEPLILTVDAFERLLKVADAGFRDLLPYLVLGGLAGLRTSEMIQERTVDEVVLWSDFKEWRLLEIRPEVAKTTTRKRGDRRYVHLDAAIEHWLEPLRKDAGRIVDRSQKSFRLRLAELEKASGFQIPHNALRHSYASYFIAGHRNYGELAGNMGTSEQTAKTHYVEVLEPTDCAKWFSIRR